MGDRFNCFNITSAPKIEAMKPLLFTITIYNIYIYINTNVVENHYFNVSRGGHLSGEFIGLYGSLGNLGVVFSVGGIGEAIEAMK